MIIVSIKSSVNDYCDTFTLPDQADIIIKGADGKMYRKHFTHYNSYHDPAHNKRIILDAGIWGIKNIALYNDSHTLFIKMLNCNKPSLQKDDSLWPFNNGYSKCMIVYNIVDGTTPADVEAQYECLKQSVLEFIDR